MALRGRAVVAFCCASAAVWHFAAAAPAPAQLQAAPQAQVAAGRTLFVSSCASCHGTDARGVPGRGPSLWGVGALAADFYLSTGRMPLARPGDPPERSRPAFSAVRQAALVAYVGSLGGPPVPRVDAASGSLAAGMRAFTEYCSGCHQQLARGGIVTGAVAPALQAATPRQIAEAIRLGPYAMPKFSTRQIDHQKLADIARYVRWTKAPSDAGGWGIGHIGPVPEGMVAWLLALVALLIVARLIGERTAR